MLVRIYYEDTDAGGVVYYANYLKFLERCRTEWLRAIGADQADLLRDLRIAFVVRSVSLEYLKPARLDDLIRIDLNVEKISRTQVFFAQHIWREHPEMCREALIDAKIRVVCVDALRMKVVAFPPSLRGVFPEIQ
ncbi:MAG: tol-pal system-associated acyl-CoA thioesterase [Candidatus Accumulibacter sp.]|nr:tol-pal system-associated acyl-CoA thioesterase [Accumulibacter sp.]